MAESEKLRGALRGINLNLIDDHVEKGLDRLEKVRPPPTVDFCKSRFDDCFVLTGADLYHSEP